MQKLILVVFFFLGLSWVNLFVTPPVIFAADPNEIYVQPVPGLKKGLFGINTRTTIEALIDDNYQAYCAAPTQEMSPEVAGEYKRFLELYFETNDEDEKEIITQISEPGTIKNPLITDPTGDGFKKESIVNYQYRSKTEPNAINSNIITDGVYRQRSLYQQCVYSQASRRATIAYCQKLEDTKLSDCPLNSDIPGMAGIQVADVDINCEDLKDPEKFLILEKWKLQAMANMPDVSANVNNAKPAWLMICFNQTPGSGVWFDGTPAPQGPMTFWQESFWTQFFNRIGKRDECYVKYAHIPVATTEQNTYLEKYALEVHDQGKKAFMSLTQQVAEEERFKSARGGRKELALGEEAEGFNNDKLVNLKESEDEFKKALAFIINGTAPACDAESVRTEEAPTIGSDSTPEEGGAKYKDSDDDAYGTWSKGGLFSTLVAKIKGIFLTGKRTPDDLESRPVVVRSYVFAPYSSYKDGKVSLESFFTPQEDYEKIRLIAQEDWETHAEFQNFLVGSSTNEECEPFEDYEDCHWEEVCPKQDFYVCYQEWVCEEKEFCITGNDFGAQFSTPISRNNRDASRPIFSLSPKDSAVWQHAKITLGDPSNPEQKTNIEKFLKGGGDGDDGGSSSGEELVCEEYKNRETKLPTMNELMKMTCSVAKNDSMDAQLLWGLLQIEASPMLRKIRAGDKSMSCGEIVVNSCGASAITGQLVPQCIDKTACSQAAYIADDTTDPWIKEVRENADIACDVKTSLEYTLRKRKSEKTHLTNEFTAANGRSPSEKELYYMMAGRNYGVPEDYLYQPACGDYEEVDGCGGANYCVCTMDTFKLDCGNIK